MSDRKPPYLQRLTEDEARILDLEADLVAARRENATLRKVAEAAEKHVEDCCRTDIGWRDQMRSHDALVDALAALAAAPAAEEPPKIEHREGIHEVYDHEGRYVGCIGRERWNELIRAEPSWALGSPRPAASGEPQPSRSEKIARGGEWKPAAEEPQP